MKKILSLLGITALFGVAAAGALVGSKQAGKEVKADAPSYQTYVPLVDGWVENTDGSGESTVSSLLRARNDRFWSGGSGWDSQERTFNSTDEFIDSIHRANGGEGWRGAYRTPELELYDNDHRYISFDFGGGASDIFINIFQVSGEAGSGDRMTGIQPFFDGSGSYDESLPEADKLNAPRTCNMTFRYYELPSEIKPGEKFLLYVRDGKTSGYGGFTFGNVHINQTLEDVAKSFSVHKTQMKLNKYTSIWNSNAIDSVLDFYDNDAYYATVRTAEAALTEADDDFEVNEHLSNWAYDTQFSSYGLDFNNAVSTNDAKDWTERMPANKTGNSYFNGDVTDGQESEKYRLVSSEFTLSGNGFISAKLGGGTAVLALIDSDGVELVHSRIATSEGTNILNAGFADNGNAGNIMDSGSRYNTMSRTYLDASAHLGKKVRVRISDDRTGGNWGLAYFDEIVTKYTSLPTLKVDKIQQQWGENPLYHGVVTDKYVGSNSTTFGKAYAFVQTFYSVLRVKANGVNYCSVYNQQNVKDLVTSYENLEPEVKVLVDLAQDFDFGSAATSANFYLTEANLNYAVGQTMTYVADLVTNGPLANSLVNGIINSEKNGAILVVIIMFAGLTASASLLVILKKKHRQTKLKLAGLSRLFKSI